MLRGSLVTLGGLGVLYNTVTDAEQRRSVPNTWGGFIRFSRTVSNFAVTVIDYKISFFGIDKDLDNEKYHQIQKQFSKRAATRLFEVCRKNGGVYTKFGQTVANMNNVFPKEIIEILSPLQDKAKEMSYEKACQVIKEDLGKDVHEVFSKFERKPVAAASLAQVHEAILKDSNEKVAVKLQYSHLNNQVKGDTATIQLLARFVGYWFPDFSYTWIIPEFRDNMVLELDFVQEGKNAERLSRMFKHRNDVYVPKIHWVYTSKRVLTMEYIDGYKVNNLKAMHEDGIHPLDVAKTVSTVFGDMIHVHGFVHCDPHPGNLFVRPQEEIQPSSWFARSISSLVSNYGFTVIAFTLVSKFCSLLSIPGLACLAGLYSTKYIVTTISRISSDNFEIARGKAFQLVVLDHGMYRRLEPDFRENYCMLWKSLLLRDTENGEKAAMKLGVDRDLYDTLSLIFTFRSPSSKSKMGARLSKQDRLRLREKYKDVTAGDVNNFLQLLPRDILFVLRSTNIVRSINLALGGTSRERFKIMGESAVRGILIPNPPYQVTDPELFSGPYKVNLPVSSELVTGASDRMTWKQLLEVIRLRSFINLVDSNWWLLSSLAYLIKTI